jgi:hypothetical protein
VLFFVGKQEITGELATAAAKQKEDRNKIRQK